MAIDRFTTDRLTVRDWRPDVEDPSRRRSLETALGGVLTPPVLEPLPPPLQLTQAGISEWVTARAEEGDVLLITANETDELIGLLLLASDLESDRPAIHIGYLLAETAWGKGYATELVTGLVSAVQAKGPVHLVGGVGRDNPASARVLCKAGFHHDPDLSTADTDMFVRLVG